MTHKKCYSPFKLFYTGTGNKICQKEFDQQATNVIKLVLFKTGFYDVTNVQLNTWICYKTKQP